MDKILTKKFFVKEERFFLFFIVFEELKRSFEEMHWARMEPHFNNFGMIRAGGSVNPASLLLPDRRWSDPAASRQEIDTSTPIPWMTPGKGTHHRRRSVYNETRENTGSARGFAASAHGSLTTANDYS
jgi:hypothetical protein